METETLDSIIPEAELFSVQGGVIISRVNTAASHCNDQVLNSDTSWPIKTVVDLPTML